MSADTLTGIRVQRPQPQRDRVRRVLWVLIATLLLVLAGQLVFHFALAPSLDIRSINVQSEVAMTTQQVKALAGITEGARYFDVDVERVRERLESYPPVLSAEVHKTFPREISLVITARDPVAMALVPVGDRSVPVVFDREGVIFEVGEDVTTWDLPVISGLRFVEYSAGTRLPGVLEGLLGDLMTLRDAEPALFRVISEVRVVPESTDHFELLVYLLAYERAIRLGSSLTAGTLKNAVVVLDVMRREGVAEEVREVDFRTREVVYSGAE